MGDERDQAAFVEVLAKAGVVLPETRLPLQDLSDLDRMIDAFHQDCRDEADWLLCAGVVSVPKPKRPGCPAKQDFSGW